METNLPANPTGSPPAWLEPPRVALLPLYLELYDRLLPHLRAQVRPLLEQARAALEERGLAVWTAPVVRTAGEAAAALAEAAAHAPDLLATLHLAYSPSLETAPLLAASPLPLLLLDTSLDASFGRSVDPARLLHNHGIHGVQDLANVLRRAGKPFAVAAGAPDDPALWDRAAGEARAARAATAFRSQRVLRIGPVFPGMGDFRVPPEWLARRFGWTLAEIGAADLVPAAAAVPEEAIDAELAAWEARFTVEAPPGTLRRTARAGLGLRRVLEEGRYTAFSFNFQAFDQGDGPVATVPFLEASLAMARGLGYAGEGDVLTAGLVRALLQAWPGTTFTEMFCADWTGGSVFLSHMGEFNPALAAGRPRLYEKDYPFSAARNPAIVVGAPRPGPATLVNLAPGPDDSAALLVASVDVLEDGTHPDLRDWVRAWVRPRRPVARFLEEYSRRGGTHHLALVRGASPEDLGACGRHLGLEVHQLD